MEEAKFEQGATVITEGEPGNVLYIVEEGQLDCYKKVSDSSDEQTFLKSYQPGEVFGELALLYNAPRAASIKAMSNCALWQLDRNTFNHIVKDAAQNKRAKYEDFLQTVPILQSMDHYERSKIADTIKEQTYGPGDIVIKEGEEGTIFFIIISGEAIATKTLSSGAAPQEVMKYSPGDYFGELALLKSGVREANVVAKSELKVASIDRDSFKRLLGPLD
jgi:cAMP-dependent protein kinase regulator